MTHQSQRSHLRRTLTLATLSTAMGLAGCMTTTPVYDQHFGESVRIVRAMQTLNPETPNNADPGVRVDGRAATAAMDRYNGSYRAPQSDTNGYTVGVGAVNGGGLSNMGR